MARRERAQTFFLLMDLMQFFDLYHEGKLDVAFDVSPPTMHHMQHRASHFPCGMYKETERVACRRRL